ncbi:MAG: protein kinase [Myxococcota bacterium]
MTREETTQVVDPLLGMQLGDYQVLELIGEGGMGFVYRGVQPVVKKRVAIKVLKPEAAGEATAIQKLLAEAEAVNSIGHRGIVDIFTHGQLPDGRPYIVMEYLEGEPLDLWLKAQGRPTVQSVVEVLLDICAPLAAAHRAGVVHRDLKPSNVFLCSDSGGERFVKLLDFGLAKRGLGMNGKTAQTSQTQVSGTPDYMAPEQARALAVSGQTDIYSLGVIAFELLAGEVPFSGETPMDVMVSHVRTPAPNLAERVPGLPAGLVQLVMGMLEKKPEARPPSVEAVREALGNVLLDLGGAPRRFSSPGMPAVVRPSSPRPGGEAAPRPSTPPARAQVRTPPPAPPPEVSEEAPRVPTRRWPVVAALAGGLGLVVAGALALLGPAQEADLTAAVDPAARPPTGGPNTPSGTTPSATPLGATPSATPLAATPPGTTPPGTTPPGATPPSATPSGATPSGATAPGTTPPEQRSSPPLDPEPDEGELAPLPGVKAKPKAASAKEPPSAAALSARVQKLEARAKGRANLDPTALQFLGRFRIEATAADTPARRAKLNRALDEWERTFLR